MVRKKLEFSYFGLELDSGSTGHYIVLADIILNSSSPLFSGDFFLINSSSKFFLKLQFKSVYDRWIYGDTKRERQIEKQIGIGQICKGLL